MTAALPHVRMTIMAASQSGNAVFVAEALAERIAGVDRFHVTMIPEGSQPDLQFPETDVLLVVAATHGDGEMPDHFQPIYDALAESSPDLSHLRYGVVALGDMTYHATFCGAGKRVDALLTELGAIRIGERCEIDASTQPFAEDDALEWSEPWLGLL